MSEIFYGILVFVIVIVFVTTYTKERYVEMPKKYDKYLIIEKEKDWFLGCTMTLKNSNKIENILVYEILYNEYKVGDTINIR